MDGDMKYEAGQWCVVTVKKDKVYSKALSISSSPTEKGYLEFTKRLTASDFSSALSSLAPGDPVDIKYPFGRFMFRHDIPKIAFISGGIGITPIRSICKDLVDRGVKADIVLLYGNNKIEEVAFKDDLDQMQAQYPGLRVVHVLRSAPAGWNGRTGLISEELIRQEIPDYADRRFYMCGPPSMVHAFDKILKEALKLPQTQVVTEDFTGS
jgi:ferredoxin-NADP reductase